MYLQGGLRCGWLTLVGGSVHVRKGGGRTGIQLEAVSATVLPRGAKKKQFRMKRKNAPQKQEAQILLSASSTTTHYSFVKQQAGLQSTIRYVRDARRPYCIFRMQVDTKQ